MHKNYSNYKKETEEKVIPNVSETKIEEKKDLENEKVVEVFSREIDTLEEDVEMNGYKVIGIVKIPKINIEYPIIEIGDIDPESAKKPMKLSIINISYFRMS